MSFGTAYATKKRGQKMGCGGEAGEIPEAKADDMAARVVKKYSKGGMVANDVGVAEADKKPAQYDDLVLRDQLEDNSGPGNEHGDSRVHDDAVDRIMLKRKKDRLPSPA